MCLQRTLPLLPRDPLQLRSGARHTLGSCSPRFAKLPLLLELTLGAQAKPNGNPMDATRLMPVLLELNELRRNRFIRSELERPLDLAHDSDSP